MPGAFEPGWTESRCPFHASFPAPEAVISERGARRPACAHGFPKRLCHSSCRDPPRPDESRGHRFSYLTVLSFGVLIGRKVNLIKQLFSRHRNEESASPTSVTWPGQSGKGYQYTVYPLDAAFQPMPGLYIYAGQAEDGTWVPIYIAQTRDLHQRLEGHVRMDDAIAHGATHLHAHYCSAGQAARCSEERDLILHWQPVCNEPIEA